MTGLSPIYHMVPGAIWAGRKPWGDYAPPTLAAEGFIHCTAEPDRILTVANAFYRDDTDEYIILVIDPTRVTVEIRWALADGHCFPHIYGALNLDAVVEVIPFPRSRAGDFHLPASWSDRREADKCDPNGDTRPMSSLTDRLPGWYKRKNSAEESSHPADTGASATTGGGFDQEPVVVWGAANVMEAEIVRGRLESAGIPAFIRSEAVGGLYGLTAGSLAAAKVLVPGPLAEKAFDLLTGADEDLEEDPAEDLSEDVSFTEDEEQGDA